jgi:hypothetical protein
MRASDSLGGTARYKTENCSIICSRCICPSAAFQEALACLAEVHRGWPHVHGISVESSGAVGKRTDSECSHAERLACCGLE